MNNTYNIKSKLFLNFILDPVEDDFVKELFADEDNFLKKLIAEWTAGGVTFWEPYDDILLYQYIII